MPFGARPAYPGALVLIPSSIVDLIRALFATPPTLAVLGATPRRHRAAHYVAAYLQRNGASILPVNPHYAGEVILGSTCISTVTEATQTLSSGRRLDAVVVFRASAAVPSHLDDILQAAPHRVWLQLGIRHDPTARRLAQRGIEVVQDRCLKVDHARVFGF